MATVRNKNIQVGVENHQKGKSFEEEFCTFMKTDLKYRNAKIRGHVRSNIDSKGTQVDIIAEKSNDFEKAFRRIGYVLMCLFTILYLLFSDKSDMKILFLLLLLESLFAACIFISYKHNVEHAWVECKNQKEKVSVEQVQKMISSCNAYKATKGRQFHFMTMYFVSSSGFVDDAFHFASSKGVKCYIVNKIGIFEEATYWSI